MGVIAPEGNCGTYWLFSTLIGISCIDRPSPTTPTCDQSGLAAVALMLGQLDTNQRGRNAAQAIVDHCELPEVEPKLRLFYLGERSNKLQPLEPWAHVREVTCPGWNHSRTSTASQSAQVRAHHLWTTCHYGERRLVSFETWYESGADDLPFVVFDLLRQAEVGGPVATTLVRALIQPSAPRLNP